MAAFTRSTFVLALISVLLGGCGGGGLLYPSTANIDKITTKTLSPAEQKAVIEDMQKSEDSSTPKTIPLITGSTSAE